MNSKRLISLNVKCNNYLWLILFSYHRYRNIHDIYSWQNISIFYGVHLNLSKLPFMNILVTKMVISWKVIRLLQICQNVGRPNPRPPNLAIFLSKICSVYIINFQDGWILIYKLNPKTYVELLYILQKCVLGVEIRMFILIWRHCWCYRPIFSELGHCKQLKSRFNKNFLETTRTKI